MLSGEYTGKTLEQAIENGLLDLKVSRDDVEIKILETGGFFKKAKVKIIVDAEIEKKILGRKQNIEKLEEKLKQEESGDKEEITAKNIENEEQCECFEECCSCEECRSCEDNYECKNDCTCESFNQSEDKEEQIEEQAKQVELSENALWIKDYLTKFMSYLNVVGEINIIEDSDVINVSINSENPSILIGYRGEAMNAIQHICNIALEKVDRDCKKVYVNINDFKQEREQTLIRLARKIACRVAKTKRSEKLEPMTAYERKIIHTALQNDEYVTTHSEGEEPRRYLVIELK